VNFDQVISKILLPAVASPVIAGITAMIAAYLAYRISRHAKERPVTSGFRHGQTVSASLVSLAHGTNDAQKTMGVITLTLIATGALAAGSAPSYWVIATAGLAIGLGTYVGAGGSFTRWATAD
jgi:inorganic phosphate transporter, PiT family